MHETSTQLNSFADSEIWLRCYVAALTGLLAAHQGAAQLNPEEIAQRCGEIADAALKEQRRRRERP